MKAARMGTMKLKARLPVLLKKAARGVEEPKAAVPAAPPSSRKDRAMTMPPPMTKGSMWDTPFIRCL